MGVHPARVGGIVRVSIVTHDPRSQVGGITASEHPAGEAFSCRIAMRLSPSVFLHRSSFVRVEGRHCAATSHLYPYELRLLQGV